MRLKKFFNLRKMIRNGKILLLAYDQGIEHGPADFNDKNVDPGYVIDIAAMGGYTGLVLQKGIAEKYYDKMKRLKVPLVLKLNGKTSLVKGDPVSRQLATVEEARDLGAVAVGYTIYIGSVHEEEMLVEASHIQKEAHEWGLPLILWIYPRGAGLKNIKRSDLMAYATRVALTIGADVVKIHPEGSMKDFAWAVKSAGRVRVICAGGSKISEKKLLSNIKGYMESGGNGMAIGRNVWQDKDPLKLSEKIRDVVWK
jgi:class I fructose-bisphosphate aldolase